MTLNPAGGNAGLALASGSTYKTGQTQRWTVTITDPNTALRGAFQLTASGGTFTASSGTVVNSAANGRQYVNHASTGTSFSFDWTPPAGGADVMVWLAGVAARGTRQTNVYTYSVTLKATAEAKPAIESAAGVVNAASLQAGMSPGAWVTVFGRNLAPAGVARSWAASEIVNGALPTALDGTQVKINGKAAAISYLSETQINAQVPDDESRGPVAVEVTTMAGTSDAVPVPMMAEAPALFRFGAAEGRYAAAVHADGVYAGPVGLYGTAVAVRPAKPGDIVLLFGTGFGPTDPAVPALQAFSRASPLRNLASLHIRIGGLEASVQFAGLVAPGLVQMNVVVPEAADGDARVEAEVAGQTAAGAPYLAILR